MRIDPLLTTPNSSISGPQLDPSSVEQLDEAHAAEQFTTVLMSLVVKEMFKTTSTDGTEMFGNGPGADVYRGFAQQAFAEALAKHGMDELVEQVRTAISKQRSETTP